ncbi:acyl-CoA--sterol O-acyltransferase 1-like [Diospyros lotus]|uniref:acyl-CoA--sterol O-acyltransferase 1-like n=1 Tax=Diospyros lotus TaxID=55363 RepID=UPI002254C32A|nr:acyl-CoA--sterol O-acyltransferase 1-like [Diospyros lotus]
MEGEIRNVIAVWFTVLASLCYCHAAAKFVGGSGARLCAFVPIICLFLYLPLELTTIHFGSTTAFFISWLANFKLLLFAFGKGPLSSDPPVSLRHFILLACLPIKPQPQKPQGKEITTKSCHKSPLDYATKIGLLLVFVQVYRHKELVHPGILPALYGFHIYFTLELLLAMAAAVVRALTHLELEPQFDEPFLSTSLQDFWGRRWNLVVTGILRPSVYDPVRSISRRVVGPKWAALSATLATFLVSGLMHELIFYYAGRRKPTLEVTAFFLIHGVCLAAEINIKKALNGKFRLPEIVSRPLVICFVMVTGLWLFLPPILRFEADVRAQRETAAFVEFMMHAIGASGSKSYNQTN